MVKDAITQCKIDKNNNFSCRFFDRSDFEYVEMDTDSAYMGLSGPMESLIKEDMKIDFYIEYGDWFPRQYCEEHHLDFVDTKAHDEEWVMKPCCKEKFLYDRRTPGLFKDEFTGIGIIALNSKTYFCWDEEDQIKLSSKGLNKKINDLKRQCFEDVLNSKKTKLGLNKGFAVKNGGVYTYEQTKHGLSYLYAKKKVCEDGVSTENICA